MTTESKLDDVIENDLGYVPTLTSQIKAKNKPWAQQLHELGYVYALYGALDGLSISYSTLKYFFDIYLNNSDRSSSDVMHEWMLTPAGIAIAATESITIIGFSLMASLFDNGKDDNNFKKFIVILWPYMRDTLKALKNSYKGIRTTFQVINLLGGLELNYLMVPTALLLGGLSVVNRLLFRYMLEQRKTMMKSNALLLGKIQQAESITIQEYNDFREQIQKQNTYVQKAALLSAAYGGVVDSLYLYIGVLGLCSLAWPALVAMTVFCVIYSVACIATRIYDEYDNQRKLAIIQAKIELELYTKLHGVRMQAVFARLQEISKEIASDNKTEELLKEQHDLAKEIGGYIKEFSAKRAHLQSLTTLSPLSAFLAGTKNGLAAYGVLTSILFAVATILVFTSTAFPPALLITCVAVGFAMLLGFIAHSLYHNYKHRAKQELSTAKPYDRLWDMLKVLKDVNQSRMTEDMSEEVKIIIGEGLAVDPSPQFFFQEWFEVIRSFFSGLGKGPKSVDYALNPLQQPDGDGHYRESTVMIFLSILMAGVYACALALRAYARGFGRPPIDQAILPAKNTESELKVVKTDYDDLDELYRLRKCTYFSEPDLIKEETADLLEPRPSSRKGSGLDSFQQRSDSNIAIPISRADSITHLSFFNSSPKRNKALLSFEDDPVISLSASVPMALTAV